MLNTSPRRYLAEAPGRLVTQTLVLDEPAPDEVARRRSFRRPLSFGPPRDRGDLARDLPDSARPRGIRVVRRVGDRVRSLRPGDHVVTCLSAYCGECRFCLDGRLTLCTGRGSMRERRTPVLTDADGRSVHPTAGIGAFATAMVVHERSLVRVPDSMPLAPAAVLGCAVVTGMSAVFRSAEVKPGSSVAVLGCGGIGIAAIQGARLAGAATIVAVDTDLARLEAARGFGATDVVDAKSSDVVAEVRDLTGGVDYSFEAIGYATTVEQSFAMLGPGGTATVLGLVPDSQPLTIAASELFVSEKRLQGSFMGSNRFPTDIPRYVRFYEQGRLNLDDMLSAFVGLDEINEGFDRMRDGGVTRVVVDVRRDR
ncbi:zinc-binding dehydrogenase [Gordonia spumicola]|uniref:zinc-binding dehydrogenase n=1 Tax=Gordonia spumicola TaxID=589161 RepID=UPI003FCD880C